MTKKHDIKEENIINIIKFIKDEKAYKKFIDGEKEDIEILKKQYSLIKELLSNDLKFINPSVEFEDKLGEAGKRFVNPPSIFLDETKEFKLNRFSFVDLSKKANERVFKIEIKFLLHCSKKYVKNEGYRLINKKEVRNKLLDVLYWTGYEIGKMEMLLSELEIQKAIILNDRNIIKINESIYEVTELFYNQNLMLVVRNPKKYPILFQFIPYIIKKYNIPQEQAFQKISDITFNEIDVKAVKRTYLNHKKKNKLIEF